MVLRRAFSSAIRCLSTAWEDSSFRFLHSHMKDGNIDNDGSSVSPSPYSWHIFGNVHSAKGFEGVSINTVNLKLFFDTRRWSISRNSWSFRGEYFPLSHTMLNTAPSFSSAGVWYTARMEFLRVSRVACSIFTVHLNDFTRFGLTITSNSATQQLISKKYSILF